MQQVPVAERDQVSGGNGATRSELRAPVGGARQDLRDHRPVVPVAPGTSHRAPALSVAFARRWPKLTRLFIATTAVLVGVAIFPGVQTALLMNAASVVVAHTYAGPPPPFWGAASARTSEWIITSLSDYNARASSPRIARKLAQLQASTGRWEEARAVLEAAARRFPTDVLLALQYGDVLYRLGDEEGALAQWRRAGVSPSYLLAHRMGYGTDRSLPTAEQRRSLIARLWPERSSTWYVVGMMYWGGGLNDAALEAFRRATLLDTGWANQTERYLSFLNLGLISEHLGDYQGAYRAFSMCLVMLEEMEGENQVTVSDIRGRLDRLRPRL